MNTKNILLLLITVLLFSCNGKTGKNTPEQMLTAFYIQYIAEQSKPRPDEKVISALYDKYLTAELRQKLEQADLEYSPFLWSQECDKDWAKTLVITHSEEDESKYGVSFSFLADVDESGVETRRYIWLSLVKENGDYRINEIQGLSEEAAEGAEFDYDKLTAKSLYDFMPPNYEVLQTIEEETIYFSVLLISATDSKLNVQDKERGELNLNRCGIILAGYDGENYQLIYRNESFFESDSKGGDGYSAPELSVGIHDGNILTFVYTHDIEGSWKYTFRYQDNGFYLIGYESHIGSLDFSKTEYSINFLTEKMKITVYKEREGQSEDEEPRYDPEIQWKDIEVEVPYRLSSDDEGGVEGLNEYVSNFIE